MEFKFLLAAVNAKYIHSNPAIYSLRACAGEELRRHVELAEYTINQQMQEILADIYARKPDAIGFSCYIWNWRLIRELLTELPKLLPGTALWLGGPEVSYDADVILRKYPQLAGIMVGEGEDTFRELLQYYTEGAWPTEGIRPTEGTWSTEGTRPAEGTWSTEGTRPAEGAWSAEGIWSTEGTRPAEDVWSIERTCLTAGLSRRAACSSVPAADGPALAGGRPAARASASGRKLEEIRGLCLPAGYTPCRALTDLSGIPFLYSDLGPFENRIIYYETSRGCPFRCSYCLSSIEKSVRFRDMDMVKRELQFFLDHRVKQVKFVDRTFNCNHEHAMEIWRYLYEHDNGVTNFHFEISADILQKEEIELLNRFRPGLAQLEIGVQSVNPHTLRAICRGMDMEKLEKNVAAIHEGGNVHQHLDLIAGLPFEDYASFGNSFNRVYRMRPEQLQLGFLKVLKGSEMRERAQEYGIRCLEEPPYEVLCTKWLSYEDMLRLKQIEEMVELYYNSGQFTHTMPFLERAFGNPFAMYETLAEFYARNGYLAAGPARVHRYRILLAFASEYDGARLAVYRELLTYDMYLRENMKSRPEFAADLSLYKDIVRSFYKREEQERALLPDYRPYDWKQMAKMTHMEPFSYPVWDVERMLEKYEDCALGASAQKQENSAFEASAGKHEDSAFGACAEKQGDSAFGASAQKQGNSAFEAPAGKQRDSASGACAEKQEDSALKSSAEKQGGSSYKSGAVRQFVLFDYQKRNPLNNEAAVQCIALPVI